jgi:hypothetical protein
MLEAFKISQITSFAIGSSPILQKFLALFYVLSSQLVHIWLNIKISLHDCAYSNENEGTVKIYYLKIYKSW